MKPNILVSITGNKPHHWQEKLAEIKRRNIKEAALFLELYGKQEKQEIYEALLKSCVKSIPLVHIRHDMAVSELQFLQKYFKTKYFTCHEENFADNNLSHWKGFYNNIYLEMNFDNFVSKKVAVEKIGGFCVDLAHFKCGLENITRDFEYVLDHRYKKYFACNHLNGYNPEKNVDMHTIHSYDDFDYLKLLPNFVLANCIALETFNPIREQVEFKKYLTELLSKKFSH